MIGYIHEGVRVLLTDKCAIIYESVGLSFDYAIVDSVGKGSHVVYPFRV